MITEEFLSELAQTYEKNDILQFVATLFREWKKWSRADLVMNRDVILDTEDADKARNAILKLKNHVPVQYIIGITEFLDVKIRVGEGVLIPRPETEELVTEIISDFRQGQHKGFKLLDIGTGSGCIAIALKKSLPGLEITATDISHDALSMARENALINNCAVDLIKSDIFDHKAWTSFPEFDIIVSNPPYVTLSEREYMEPNVLEYEPSTALFVPDNDPLCYHRAIGEFGLNHFIRPGHLYLEINEKFGKEMRIMLMQEGYNEVLVLKDIFGKDRFVKAIIK